MRTRIMAAVAAVLVLAPAAGGVWLYGELDTTQEALMETQSHLRQESAMLIRDV